MSEALVTAASQLPADPAEDRQAEQQPAAEHAIQQQSPDSSQHGFSVPPGTLPRPVRDGRSGNNGVTGTASSIAVRLIGRGKLMVPAGTTGA